MEKKTPQNAPDSYGTGKAPVERSRAPFVFALLGILLGTNLITAGFFFDFGRASQPISPQVSAESTEIDESREAEQAELTEEIISGLAEIAALRQGEAVDGMGIILSSDGYILTNAAVVESAETLTVILEDGRSFAAQLVGFDLSSDVAVLKIAAEGLQPAEYAQSDTVAVGDRLTMFPFPFDPTELTGIFVEDSRQLIGGMDRRIFPVNCGVGGLLVDEEGNLVAFGTKHGEALPISEAVFLAGELIFYGELNDPSSFGMEIALLDEAQRSYWELPGGVAIARVAQGGNAQQAGLQTGDVLLSINGMEIYDTESYWEALQTCREEDCAQVEIYRSGVRMVLELFLG